MKPPFGKFKYLFSKLQMLILKEDFKDIEWANIEKTTMMVDRMWPLIFMKLQISAQKIPRTSPAVFLFLEDDACLILMVAGLKYLSS